MLGTLRRSLVECAAWNLLGSLLDKGPVSLGHRTAAPILQNPDEAI